MAAAKTNAKKIGTKKIGTKKVATSPYLFYSGSKDLTLRYLSNFTRAPTPLSIDAKLCVKYGVRSMEGSFDSVEAVFQGAKRCYLKSGDIESYKKFTADGKYSVSESTGGVKGGLAAKRAGGKNGTAADGCVLDIVEWGKAQMKVMEMAVAARAAVDAKYSEALKQALTNGHAWLHFEKSGKKSFWGGCFEKATGNWVGNNRLGQIMAKVATSL